MRARPRPAPSGCRPGCCSSSPRRQIVRGRRGVAGPAASTGGRRWSAGSPDGIPPLPVPRARADSSAATWRGSGRPPTPTSSGGPAGPWRRPSGAGGRRGRRAGSGRGGAAGSCPTTSSPVARPKPWVALLPPLDPTTMGWRAAGLVSGRTTAHLFDRNGNAGPTIWVNGRVVGGWAQRRSGEVVTACWRTSDARRRGRWPPRRRGSRSGSAQAPAIARFPTPLAKELLL